MIIPKTLIAGSQLTASASTYYLAPANTKAIIHNMTLANPTASSIAATVHVVDTGASETSSNIVIAARTIAAGETYKCPEVVGKTLSATGTIRAFAGQVSTITIMAHGVEVT